MSDKNYSSYWKGHCDGIEFEKGRRHGTEDTIQGVINLIDEEITKADTRQDFTDLGLGTYFHGVIRGLQILKEKLESRE